MKRRNWLGQKWRFTDFRELYIAGAISVTSSQHVHINYADNQDAFVPVDKFFDKNVAAEAIWEAGIHLRHPSLTQHIMQNMPSLEFEPAPILDRPGAASGVFGFRCGKVIPRDISQPIHAAYRHKPEFRQVRGTRRGWRKRRASPLERQHLLMGIAAFTIDATYRGMLGEAQAPIIEIIDAAGSRGSLPAIIAGELIGSTEQPLVSFSDVTNNYDDLRTSYSDGLMMIGDPLSTIAGESQLSIQRTVRQFISSVTAPVNSSPSNSTVERRPVTHMIFARQSIFDAIGLHSPLANLIKPEIVTFHVSAGGALRPTRRTGRDRDHLTLFTDKYRRNAGRHQGVALECFVKAILKEQSVDPHALSARRRRWVANFKDRIRTDQDPASGSTANFFAEVYASAREAQWQWILPHGWQCGAALIALYRQQSEALSDKRPALERLEAVAARDDVIDMKKGLRYPVSAIENGKIFLKHRKEYRELIIDEDFITDIISDFRWFHQQPEAAMLMIRDGDHLGTKRQIKGRETKRYICFRLPSLAIKKTAI